jgi:hypothetical protein
MKIAYDNLLESATITSTSENANYPVENLYHNWKRKYFQAGDDVLSLTLTLEWSIPQTIEAICIAYHNLDGATATFYDGSDVVLDTWTISVDYDTDMTYGSQTGVYKIELALSAPVTIYLGNLFVGEVIQNPKSADQDIPLYSSDVVSSSSDRQIAGRKGSVTRGGSISIPLLTSAERKEIESIFYDRGKIEPFYLDLWDLSHADFEPLYCVFESDIQGSHKEEGDTVSFDIKEVN